MEPSLLLKNITLAACRVDDFLIRFIKSEEQIPNLHEGIIYALGLDSDDVMFRGKRLRPALGLLVCEVLGANPDAPLPFAAAIELFHNFTLVHDDIEDGDTYRRNRPCVYVKYGLAHGINIGDFMLVKVFRALTESSEYHLPPRKQIRLLRLMIDTLEHTHIGQALDINARASRNFSIRDYLRLVTEKTGYCLAAPMLAASIVAGARPAVRYAIENYAKSIGPLFQIKDDVIDLTKGKGRGSIGSDVREGKRSFLVAYVTNNCTQREREQLYRILDASRAKTTDTQIEWVRGLFEKYGSFDAAGCECERLLQSALNAIAKTPPNLRELLEAFAELLLKRKR